MGNATSSITSVLTSPIIGATANEGKSSSKSSKDKKHKDASGKDDTTTTAAAARTAAQQAAEYTTEKAKQVLGDVQATFQKNVRKLEEQDHPAAHLIDTVCGPMFDHTAASSKSRKMRKNESASFYSDDIDSDADDLDSRQTISEDEQTLDTDYNSSTVNNNNANGTVTSSSEVKDGATSPSEFDESNDGRRRNKRGDKHNHHHRSSAGRHHHHHAHPEDQSIDESEDSRPHHHHEGPGTILSKPLASSFAKRCYFTKAGIGKTTQHYEGLTLTGNVVLMLAAAMKLKGCPTICDEDLRRVEQTYPNQFSRLPDELLLSSGWRRISKYCHFSNKPIPDGIPFFHSKQRVHPQTGGFYFLLAAAVGMVRPIDVEPLTRDTLVLLETDYPSQCDAAPEVLIKDPEQWTLVDKFCFFSGGPINTEEDVYYQADFDGNPIYMLAFLSPSLTPEELYKLDATEEEDVPGLRSVAEVDDVESVYDLTERDFHDLKLYHLGPCRALPQYILQPHAWTKVLPPHFLEARHRAILRAQEFEMRHGGPLTPALHDIPLGAPAQKLTVGATPLDGRYHGDAYPAQQQYADSDPGVMMDEQQYYMHQDGNMLLHHTQPNYSDTDHSYGPQTPMEYQQQQHPQYQQYEDEQQPHYQQEPEYYHQQYPDDFRREMEEEGAFTDTNSAPLDEAIAHTRGQYSPGPHKHQMDPPEEVNGGNNGNASYEESENGSPQRRDGGNHRQNSHSPGYYAQAEESLEVSKTDSNYSHEGMSPVRRSVEGSPYQNGTADYYTTNPEEDDDEYFNDDELARDQHYYGSADGPPQPTGSHDHEFFDAPSGVADDNTEGYCSSAFDPRNMSHPEDGHLPGVSYDDEGSSRLVVQESSSSVDYHKQKRIQGQSSSSPIKTDHLKRLARQNEQQLPQPSPRNGESVTSITSPTSQNSQGEFSHSSAMRGAQELLKRNRQRRQEMARRRLNQSTNTSRGGPPPDEPESREKPNQQYAFPGDDGSKGTHREDEDGSAATWESGNSDALNSVGESSVWTDTSSTHADRSSRRALILQMAKARMKSNKERDPAEHAIAEEKSNEAEDDPMNVTVDHHDSADLTSRDLDFAADLD